MLENIFILVAVVIGSIFVGTGIRLTILRVKNSLVYTLLIPCVVIKSDIDFISGKIIPFNGGIVSNIKEIFRRMVYTVHNFPADIALGCYVAQEVEQKNKKSVKKQYQRYTASYMRKLNNHMRYA